ncbi:MAG: hypothetical protein ACK5Q5_15965 [Planctomycetaceae bacterium]
MPRRLTCLTFLLASCLASLAQAGWLCGGCKPTGCGCQVNWVCCPTCEQEKIEKSGFDVECEHICVPKVRLPWQSCCTPRCARVICVHRLKKQTIECGEKCVIQWEAKPVCRYCGKPRTGTDSNGGCGPAACVAPGDDRGPTPMPAAAAQ